MKTNFKTNLRIGSVELQRIFELVDLESHNLDNYMIKSYGLVISEDSNFALAGGWKPTAAGSNTLQVAAGTGIFKGPNNNPRPVELSTTNVAIPTTADTYLVTAKYAASNFEKGTISVNNGSDQVTGSGTEFRKIFAANRRLIVNDTAYQILSVESDTALTLTAVFPDPDVDGAQFKVGGWFTSYPPAISDNLIYEHNAVTFTVYTSLQVPGANEYNIAQVVVSGGIITDVRDKRVDNLFQIARRDLIANTNGTYAKTTGVHDEESTAITVGDGQTRNFPSSYTADFNTCFLIHDAGIIGFKYTSKTSSRFLGVTFDAGGFNSSLGSYVFHKDSIVINNDSLIVGGLPIKFIPSVDTGLWSTILSQKFLQLQGRTHIKAPTLVLGENANGDDGWVERSAFIIHEDFANDQLLVRLAAASSGGISQDVNLVFDITGANSSFGKYIFKKDGTEMARIEEPGRINLTDIIGTIAYFTTFQLGTGGTAPKILGGIDSPEGVVTAPPGSLFLRTNGGAGTTLYVKESGISNTGWVAK